VFSPLIWRKERSNEYYRILVNAQKVNSKLTISLILLWSTWTWFTSVSWASLILSTDSGWVTVQHLHLLARVYIKHHGNNIVRQRAHTWDSLWSKMNHINCQCLTYQTTDFIFLKRKSSMSSVFILEMIRIDFPQKNSEEIFWHEREIFFFLVQDPNVFGLVIFLVYCTANTILQTKCKRICSWLWWYIL